MIDRKIAQKVTEQLTRACKCFFLPLDKENRTKFCKRFHNSDFCKESKRLAILVGIPAFIAFCFTEQSVQSAAVIGAVFLYFTEFSSRKAERHSRLWQAIDGAAVAGRATSYARKQALEELAKDGVSLARLDLANVDLVKANLYGADLRLAKLNGANLIGAKLNRSELRLAVLIGANLSSARLNGAGLCLADLSEAKLDGASLIGADLSEAILSGADLQWADLTGVKNVTPEQIKSAKNWQLAEYEPEFRQQLVARVN